MKRYWYIILLFIVIPINLYSHGYENLWGINSDELLKKIPGDKSYEIFKPQDKNKYNNRAITFFQAMGGSSSSINILRIKGTPDKDFCFFNGRLYSVSEEWNMIRTDKAEKLIKNIESRYDRENTVTKNRMTILTYKKNKTRVIIYKRPEDSRNFKVKILFYSNDIFNILLTE